MNKFLKVVAALCIICLLVSSVPASFAYFSDAGDNHLLYGRKQLQGKANSDNLTAAYDRIVNGIENRDESILLSDLSITKNELIHVVSLYKNDPHAHFWLSNGYSYSSFTDGTVYAFKPAYNELGTVSDDEFQNEIDSFNSATDSIIKKAGIKDGMSQYEIELRIHDTLVKELDYINTQNAFNSFGAIVEKNAVCQGYTQAFNYILRLCGIEAHYVAGYSNNGAHAWSLVNIDGNYYYTDITWDDPINAYNGASEIYHTYFNVSYNTLSSDHSFKDISYDLPLCNSESGSYFAHNPDMIMTAAPNAALVASLFKDGIAAVYVPEELLNTFLDWYGKNLLEIAELAGYDVSKDISFLYTYMGSEFHLIIEGTLLSPVVNILIGDVDGDGKVSGMDANLLMRIISGSITVTSEQIARGDMDGDGRLTGVDSNLLKRLITGK